MERVAAFGEGERLAHERAERCESAAESHGKRQLQAVPLAIAAAQGQACNEADEQASGYVHRHCAPRKG